MKLDDWRSFEVLSELFRKVDFLTMRIDYSMRFPTFLLALRTRFEKEGQTKNILTILSCRIQHSKAQVFDFEKNYQIYLTAFFAVIEYVTNVFFVLTQSFVTLYF